MRHRRIAGKGKARRATGSATFCFFFVNSWKQGEDNLRQCDNAALQVCRCGAAVYVCVRFAWSGIRSRIRISRGQMSPPPMHVDTREQWTNRLCFNRGLGEGSVVRWQAASSGRGRAGRADADADASGFADSQLARGPLALGAAAGAAGFGGCGPLIEIIPPTWCEAMRCSVM